MGNPNSIKYDKKSNQLPCLNPGFLAEFSVLNFQNKPSVSKERLEGGCTHPNSHSLRTFDNGLKYLSETTHRKSWSLGTIFKGLS